MTTTTPRDAPSARYRSAHCAGSSPYGTRSGATGASGQVEEAVEDPRAELQGVDRDPLVDAVEQPGEVEVRRQPQRREPVAADPQLRPVLAVGAARHEVRR